MARPTRIPVDAGLQGWDSTVNDDFKLAFNRPLALCTKAVDESTDLTESTLQATYAAASYDQCYVWVNHSVRGWTVYRSNGTSWEIARGMQRFYTRAISGAETVQAYDDVLVCGGTSYTVTLPPASQAGSGRVVYIKRNSSGTITVDGDGSETIDGALTLSMTTAAQAVMLVCDGSNWFSFSSGGGGGGGSSTLALEAISGTATINGTTNLAVCSGTTYTVTLPSAAAVGSGWVLFVKRTSSGNIIIDGDGTETIDGATTHTLTNPFQCVELVSDGTNWSIVAAHRARPSPLGQESVTGAGTINALTDLAICSGTTYTATLPAAATYGAGRVLVVKRTSSGNITLDGDSTETIDGSATFVLDVIYMSVSLYCDGSNWHLI